MEDVAALGVLKVSRCVHLRRLNALFETFCPSLRARSVLAEQKKNDLMERILCLNKNVMISTEPNEVLKTH